jgi:hypothetical protein
MRRRRVPLDPAFADSRYRDALFGAAGPSMLYVKKPIIISSHV